MIESTPMRSLSRFHPDHCRSPCLRTSAAGRRATRRGAVTVEMALIAPFLVTLLLGICEIGQVQRVQCYLSEAAYSGCVAGSLPGCTNTRVISEVKNFLTASKMNSDEAEITIKVNDVIREVGTSTRNDKVTVTVSIPVTATSWTGSHFFVSESSVQSRTIVMLRQG